jgi:hypothetical protein
MIPTESNRYNRCQLSRHAAPSTHEPLQDAQPLRSRECRPSPDRVVRPAHGLWGGVRACRVPWPCRPTWLNHTVCSPGVHVTRSAHPGVNDETRLCATLPPSLLPSDQPPAGLPHLRPGRRVRPAGEGRSPAAPTPPAASCCLCSRCCCCSCCSPLMPALVCLAEERTGLWGLPPPSRERPRAWEGWTAQHSAATAACAQGAGYPRPGPSWQPQAAGV